LMSAQGSVNAQDTQSQRLSLSSKWKIWECFLFSGFLDLWLAKKSCQFWWISCKRIRNMWAYRYSHFEIGERNLEDMLSSCQSLNVLEVVCGIFKTQNISTLSAF
jgi:hypothetical protein